MSDPDPHTQTTALEQDVLSVLVNHGLFDKLTRGQLLFQVQVMLSLLQEKVDAGPAEQPAAEPSSA